MLGERSVRAEGLPADPGECLQKGDRKNEPDQPNEELVCVQQNFLRHPAALLPAHQEADHDGHSQDAREKDADRCKCF